MAGDHFDSYNCLGLQGVRNQAIPVWLCGRLVVIGGHASLSKAVVLSNRPVVGSVVGGTALLAVLGYALLRIFEP